MKWFHNHYLRRNNKTEFDHMINNKIVYLKLVDDQAFVSISQNQNNFVWYLKTSIKLTCNEIF